MEEETKEETQTWKLYIDGSSNENGSDTGIILVSPNNFKINLAIRFKFRASNNEVEYEALLVENIIVYSESQLVVNQTKEEYQAMERRCQLT